MQVLSARELNHYLVNHSIKKYLTKGEINRFNIGNNEFFKSLQLCKVLTRRQQNGLNMLWQNAKLRCRIPQRWMFNIDNIEAGKLNT